MTRSHRKQLRGSDSKLGDTLSPGVETSQGQDPKAGHKKYDEHVVKSRKAKSLVEFFRESPLMGLELDLERDREDAQRHRKRNLSLR